MEKSIDNPKVFISYSWSSEEYEEKVMNFAVRLQKDGIEVLIDKWIMEPGNDTINFMEKCVKDPGINFVLILLDKEYTLKADNKSGGVGIETQIISNKVYNDVEQSKFIPIIFDRDESGNINIPIYLKTRFYYDLTKSNAEEEYIKLVKQIYGRKIYYKPELGNRPDWVDKSLNIPSTLKFKILNKTKSLTSYEALIQEIKTANLAENIEDENGDNLKKNLKMYNNSTEYRNVLLEIFLENYEDEAFVDNTCEFYEHIKKWNEQNNGVEKEIWDAFIHETFIYLIAILMKYKRYKLVNIFITKTYFPLHKEPTNIVHYFYSYNYDIISDSKCKIDEKNYYSGMAALWIENMYEPKINKDNFTQADLLLYNLSILLLEDQSWYWFPITYVYAGGYRFDSSLREFSIRLKSKYQLDRIKDLFAVTSIEEIKEIFEEKKRIMDDRKERYSYSSAFECAELITDFIKISEIGSLK